MSGQHKMFQNLMKRDIIQEFSRTCLHCPIICPKSSTLSPKFFKNLLQDSFSYSTKKHRLFPTAKLALKFFSFSSFFLCLFMTFYHKHLWNFYYLKYLFGACGDNCCCYRIKLQCYVSGWKVLLLSDKNCVFNVEMTEMMM